MTSTLLLPSQLTSTSSDETKTTIRTHLPYGTVVHVGDTYTCTLTRTRDIDVDAYMRMRSACGWDCAERRVTRDNVVDSLARTVHFVVVRRHSGCDGIIKSDDGEEVGMVRLIGDRDMYGYVSDCMLLPTLSSSPTSPPEMSPSKTPTTSTTPTHLEQTMIWLLLHGMYAQDGYLLGVCSPPHHRWVDSFLACGFRKRGDGFNPFMFADTTDAQCGVNDNMPCRIEVPAAAEADLDDAASTALASLAVAGDHDDDADDDDNVSDVALVEALMREDPEPLVMHLTLKPRPDATKLSFADAAAAAVVEKEREPQSSTEERIVIRFGMPTLEQFKRLRCDAGWPLAERGISDERAARSLAQSPIGVVALNAAGNIIGCLRTSGDLAMFGYVQDTILMSTYHGSGIGSAMLDKLLGRVQSLSCKGFLLGTCPSKVSVNFYSRFGFVTETEYNYDRWHFERRGTGIDNAFMYWDRSRFRTPNPARYRKFRPSSTTTTPSGGCGGDARDAVDDDVLNLADDVGK